MLYWICQNEYHKNRKKSELGKLLPVFNSNRYIYSSIPNRFSKYKFSDGHFTMMMQIDVTGGGPMEVSVVELLVPVLKLHFFFTRYPTKRKNCKKKFTLFGCRISLVPRPIFL